VNNVTTGGPKAVVSAAMGNVENAIKSLACWIWRSTGNVIDHNSKDNGSYMLKRFDYVKPLDNIDDKGFWDSGCSRHMTGNISYLSDYEPYDGGYVSFGYGGGKITGKGTIKTGTKEDVKQAEKEKGSPLRFIALLNWFHEAQMITTNDAAKKRGGVLIDSPQKEQ
ncbi:hypothetical protein Tco_0083119, partial [Tanacetum coccineum]